MALMTAWTGDELAVSSLRVTTRVAYANSAQHAGTTILITAYVSQLFLLHAFV